MHVFEELARQQKLLCPDTKDPVQIREGRIVSPSGREFGSLSGPLNFLKACEETLDASSVPASEIERVRAHLALPASAEVHAEIAKAIAATGGRFKESHLSAEARILAERFRIPAFNLGADGTQAASKVNRLVSAIGRVLFQPARGEDRLEHLSNSIGERLTAGQEVSRSVRVRNSGNTALRAAEGAVAKIETRWTAPDGSAVPNAFVANELPVDIEPGREITLILRVRAPDKPGRHVLHAQLVVSGATVGSPFLSVPVATILCDLPVFEYVYFPDLLEYEPDHRVAGQEVLEFLKERYDGRSASVLEIGGGVHPTGHLIAAQGHRVVSSDISHSQSILGALFFRHAMPALGETLAFISCEGTDLPFADEAFDGIVLFAAFHHFADPLSLLRELKRVTRQDGFIFIGCDNCVPNPRDPEYREELRRGINEQMWTLPEYADFFRKAGLEIARARVDYHSLKVSLVTP